MKHLDLCSGIGGFALAASWVWPKHEVAGFVEIDDYCQRVLRKHWPDAPIHSDLYDYDARPLRGHLDLLTAGYPCQPFSTAGKREGASDDRHLWPEVLRCITEARPRWVLLENVAGHVSMGLDDVLTDLEGKEYTTAQAIIPAVAVDARHRRDRVWIVAHDDLNRSERQCLHTRSRRKGVGKTDACGDSQVVAHADSTGHQKRDTGADKEARQYTRCTVEKRCKWAPEPSVGRVANGVPSRVDRLRALGNAIVPQVAEQIFRAIKRCDA